MDKNKQKFQIVLPADLHAGMKNIASESSTSIGGVIEFAVEGVVKRVRRARNIGEIPENVRASTLQIADLLFSKDRGVIDVETFEREVDELTIKPDDDKWIPTAKS
jgi:hypothetical protein